MLRVKTIFSYTTGAPWVSTMHFTNLATQADADFCNVAVGTFWTAVKAYLNSSVTYTTDAAVQDVSQSTGALQGLFGVTPQTGTGAVATEILPVVNQGLVSWRTGHFTNGREVRGRTFIPGLTEAAATLGVVTAATKTGIEAAATALIGDVNTTLCIWHRGAPGAGAGQVQAVTASAMWTKFAVLRSRRD